MIELIRILSNEVHIYGLERQRVWLRNDQEHVHHLPGGGRVWINDITDVDPTRGRTINIGYYTTQGQILNEKIGHNFWLHVHPLLGVDIIARAVKYTKCGTEVLLELVTPGPPVPVSQLGPIQY